MLLETPDAVVADDGDDREPVAHERVEVHAVEADGAVAQEQHHLAVGMGDAGGDGVAQTRSEAAVRARVHPATRLVGLDHSARVGDEVATVADHDRVAVDHLLELAVDTHRVERRARVVQLRLLGRALLVLGFAQPAKPLRAIGAARGLRAQGVERRGDPPVQLRRRLARVWVGGRRGAEHHDLRLLAERAAEAETEIHRHPNDERDVGTLQGGASRAREEAFVIGGHAPARQAVEEHGNPELLAQPPQRLLPVSPIQARAGHDRRALR